MNRSEKLNILAQYTLNCTRCHLERTRTHMVFGEGNPESPVMFIGEAPGKDEDLQGKPFVGRSGQLLSEMILEVFNWTRKDYFITNILKCRPTIDLKMIKDRPPEKVEIESCLPILSEQIKIIDPKIIVTIGASATKTLLNNSSPISALRGKWFKFENKDVMPTFHPSYLLRNGGNSSSQYKIMLEDLKKVKSLLK